MMGLVSGAEYAILGVGFLGCAAYAVIATVIHFSRRK